MLIQCCHTHCGIVSHSLFVAQKQSWLCWSPNEQDTQADSTSGNWICLGCSIAIGVSVTLAACLWHPTFSTIGLQLGEGSRVHSKQCYNLVEHQLEISFTLWSVKCIRTFLAAETYWPLKQGPCSQILLDGFQLGIRLVKDLYIFL